MHPILSKLLLKRGISRNELSEEPIAPGEPSEKDQFDRWDKILSKEEEVSLATIEQFCQAEIDKIEVKWQTLEDSTMNNQKLIIAHTIYSNILRALQSPKAEREVLEKFLNQLIS